MLTTMIQQKNKIFRAANFAALLLLSFLSSCDFTPRIHRQILIAQNYITAGDYEKAVRQYQEILEEVPPKDIKIKIFYQLGELYAISLGQYDKGLIYYDQIRNLTTEPIWLVKTGERIGDIAFTYIRDYEKSEKVYDELSNFRPKLNNYDLYEYRHAAALVEQNKLDKAVRALLPIQSNPNHKFNSESFFLQGMLHFNNKDWQKSINYLREYIKREKRKDKIVNAKYIMANAYETMEKLKTAYNIYYSILGDYPNTKVLKERLKSVYERRVARRR